MIRHQTQRYEVPASLDGPGIRFHGHREHPVPSHVWQAIRDAAQRVLDNYTRVGTPCGHVPAHEGANHCAVMICPHVLPHPPLEMTQDELTDVASRVARGLGLEPDALSPGQRHLTRIYPDLNIACSRCGSPRGVKCTSPNGRSYSPAHESRRKTWHSMPVARRNELLDQED